MKKLHLILLVVMSAMILTSLVACDADDISGIIGGLGGGSITLPEGQGGTNPFPDGIENIELPEDLIAGHTPVIDAYVAPTCTRTGLTPGAHCADCGEILVAQQEIPMTEHVYDNERDRDCNVCGYVRNTRCRHRNVEKLEGKPATCTEFGLTDGTRCRDCGELLTAQTLIPMAEHTESDWIIDKEATVDSDGSRHTECIACGLRIKTEATNKLTPSKGLVYTLNTDCKSYSVTGIGTCTDTDLIIPGIYKGMPVTAIGKNAFWKCEFLNSVSIPNRATFPSLHPQNNYCTL